MTNFEKLKQFGAENFWNEIQKMNNLQVRDYVDFPAYLESSDEDISHFIRYS